MAKEWNYRYRAGLPRMYPSMLDALKILRKAERDDDPFVDLKAPPSTKGALMRHGWIFRSEEANGIRYRITLNGLRALAINEHPRNRHDGICPNCGVNPKIKQQNGKYSAYCKECHKISSRRQYALKGKQANPKTLCSRCHRRKRRILNTGTVLPYCKRCHRGITARQRRERHAERAKNIECGEVVLCIQCLHKAVYHTPNFVSKYCKECLSEKRKPADKRYRLKKAGARNNLQLS